MRRNLLRRNVLQTLPGFAVGILALGGLTQAVASPRLAGEPTRPLASVSPAAPTSKPFDGNSAVGALFDLTASGKLAGHFCTASIVMSPHRDLLMTAAHCVSGHPAGRMVFIPAYHEGHMPFGIWHITKVFVDSKWSANWDPDDDYAFLVTAEAPSGRTIQRALGGERLVFDQPAAETVEVIGYPSDTNAPIICTNETTLVEKTQMEFDCAGFTGGTSGGPFLINVSQKTGFGTLIGVLGGYEQGGDTPSVSYAAQLRNDAAALYRTAWSSTAARAG